MYVYITLTVFVVPPVLLAVGLAGHSVRQLASLADHVERLKGGRKEER
jgi:hypothetical protein